VQAYGKLREATNTTLSVLDLFRYPTIRSLANALSPAPIGAASFGTSGGTPRAAAAKDKQ
jgi:hypothetical protein